MLGQSATSSEHDAPSLTYLWTTAYNLIQHPSTKKTHQNR